MWIADVAARMEPDPDRAGRADRYTYECGSGHSMSKTTEKKTD
jgi:hypothetical protein